MGLDCRVIRVNKEKREKKDHRVEMADLVLQEQLVPLVPRENAERLVLQDP